MSLETTGRPRRSRTRSRNVSPRPPLALSQLKPHEYDMTPLCTSVVCPDCVTWVPITAVNGKRPKLVPHDTGATRNGGPVRCAGNHRLVILDVTPDRQRQLLDRASLNPSTRRSARQHHKPTPAPAAPVSRIKAEATLETARQSYLAHRRGCTLCVKGQHCTDGGILARRYVLALDQEPARREALTEQERQERRTARKLTAPAVRRAQWAKRGGEEIETANNRCAEPIAGSISGFHGPQLPVAPQNPKGHDRRQADLGRQYAARKTQAPTPA